MASRSLMAICAVVATAAAVFLTRISDDRGEYQRPATIPFPAENPYSPEKRRLGEILFFSTDLSGSRSLSCGSCHLRSLAWTDGQARAQGEGASPLPFRTPTLLNVAWTEPLGWDGKFKTLEDVAFAPITAAGNMNASEQLVLARLAADPNIQSLFKIAFGREDITRSRIEAALATFERTLVSSEAPFDRYVAGDDQAISAEAKRGFGLFRGKAHCASCHSGWNFTDGSFHDVGTASGTDIGRGRLFPSSEKLRFAFKTPTLRDVALHPPYMHDGSIASLDAVIEHYDRGGIDRPSRSVHIRPLRLNAEEKGNLVAFLQSLTGDRPSIATAPQQALEPTRAALKGDLPQMKEAAWELRR